MTAIPVSGLINRAVCAYREAKASESRSYFSKACKAQSGKEDDMAYIFLDKAIRAAEESHAAHAALGVTFANPEDCMSPKAIETWKQVLGDKAEEAYARAEAEVEAANERRDYEMMYGND